MLLAALFPTRSGRLEAHVLSLLGPSVAGCFYSQPWYVFCVGTVGSPPAGPVAGSTTRGLRAPPSPSVFASPKGLSRVDARTRAPRCQPRLREGRGPHGPAFLNFQATSVDT